mmetsp:Transcript_15059/g.39107  ORF Transcript_15059/g.39107 Transcript_15059/m.39107 type:complete len:427 (-) Transcript_15059:36-1316(-)
MNDGLPCARLHDAHKPHDRARALLTDEVAHDIIGWNTGERMAQDGTDRVGVNDDGRRDDDAARGAFRLCVPVVVLYLRRCVHARARRFGRKREPRRVSLERGSSAMLRAAGLCVMRFVCREVVQWERCRRLHRSHCTGHLLPAVRAPHGWRVVRRAFARSRAVQRDEPFVQAERKAKVEHFDLRLRAVQLGAENHNVCRLNVAMHNWRAVRGHGGRRFRAACLLSYSRTVPGGTQGTVVEHSHARRAQHALTAILVHVVHSGRQLCRDGLCVDYFQRTVRVDDLLQIATLAQLEHHAPRLRNVGLACSAATSGRCEGLDDRNDVRVRQLADQRHLSTNVLLVRLALRAAEIARDADDFHRNRHTSAAVLCMVHFAKGAPPKELLQLVIFSKASVRILVYWGAPLLPVGVGALPADEGRAGVGGRRH